MASWLDFERCPQCGWAFATGEGDRACSYGDCPNLPEDLNVFCDSCRFNFVTMEGNSPCADPMQCDHRFEPLEHVENYRRWLERRGVLAR